ncbi:MAG: adenylosuccinate synthetase [Candidatus Ranarchaeia archaeon]
MPCKVVVGGFYGDEGKGKIMSYLAIEEKPAILVRAGVGPNAGHTVEYQGRQYKLRQVPCGFVSPDTRLLIGAGVLVNPEIFLREVEETKTRDRVGLDHNCGIIEESHIQRDQGSNHLKKVVGSTGTGTGPANMDRAERKLKLARDIDELSEYLTDVPGELFSAIEKDELVLVEGTQGTFLSLFHGQYPYVTSKDTTASQACADVGIGPTAVSDVIVVLKGFVSRVGGGGLKGELSPEEAKRRGWYETGTVTARVRRSAPFDYDLAKRAVILNGATQLAITKLDILFPQCRGAKDESDLPSEALTFIQRIEQRCGVPVTYVGTGPDASEIIRRTSAEKKVLR